MGCKCMTMILCLAGAELAWAGGDMVEAMGEGQFWGKTRQELAKELLQGVERIPTDQKTDRIPQTEELTFGEVEAGEMLIRWGEKEKPSSVLVMVYNKGDDGPLEKKSFDKSLHKAIETLNACCGCKAKPKKVSRKEAGIPVKAWCWQWKGGFFQLEAASSGRKHDFVSEFIRLKAGADEASLEQGDGSDAARKSSLKQHVKRKDSAVWIEGIPMVDQGEKGYCVPATVSRIFAYYGMDGVDQHTLAALCNSTGGEGTSVREMYDALLDIGKAFHVRVQPLDDDEGVMSFVNAYNKAAKKLKKEPVSPEDFATATWDAEVLKLGRAGKSAQIKKWLAPLIKSIEAGLPVIWSVRLGVFPEKDIPQSRGGHMRLLLGYDEERKVIFYSDSWGAGHERKEMPLEQACSISVSRYILKPSR